MIAHISVQKVCGPTVGNFDSTDHICNGLNEESFHLKVIVNHEDCHFNYLTSKNIGGRILFPIKNHTGLETTDVILNRLSDLIVTRVFCCIHS